MKKVYLAGGLFTTAEVLFNAALASSLRSKGLEVWLPQEHQGEYPEAIFQNCLAGIDWCDVVVANMDGPDPDSGTSAECGLAYRGRPIVAYRTDFRGGGEVETGVGYNLMLWGMADVRLDLSYVHILSNPLVAIAEAIHKAVSNFSVVKTGCSRPLWEGHRQATIKETLDHLKKEEQVILPEDGQKTNKPSSDFVVFKAVHDGHEIGISVLSMEWSSKEVLMQLAVDNCPLGMTKDGLPSVSGWPADIFDVQTTTGIIRFVADR